MRWHVWVVVAMGMLGCDAEQEQAAPVQVEVEPLDPCFPADGICQPEGRWRLVGPTFWAGVDNQTFEIGRDESGALTSTLRFGNKETPPRTLRMEPDCRLIFEASESWSVPSEMEGSIYHMVLLVDLSGDRGRGWAIAADEFGPYGPGEVRLVRDVAGVDESCLAVHPQGCLPSSARPGCDLAGRWVAEDAPEACGAVELNLQYSLDGLWLCAENALRLLPTEDPCGVYVEQGEVRLFESTVDIQRAMRLRPQQGELLIEDASCESDPLVVQRE